MRVQDKLALIPWLNLKEKEVKGKCPSSGEVPKENISLDVCISTLNGGYYRVRKTFGG